MGLVAKLFMNGRSQAVRLPKEFRFEGDTVRVSRMGRGVLVEPMFADAAGWFAELDRCAPSADFMAGKRRDPKPPVRDMF